MTDSQPPSVAEDVPPVPSDTRHAVATGDLKGQTLRGALAKVGSQGASFVARIGSLMVLARLLEPADFGLVAMVTVVTGVFSLFKDAGLSMITVQRADITDDQVSVLFWLNLLVGTVLTVLSIAMAPVLVAFYREPRLFWVSVAMGIGFLCNAVGVQHAALLQRQMRFTALAIIEVSSLLASIVVGIGLALTGFGYWALVGMAVSLPLVFSAGSWMTAGWIPRMPRRGIGIASMVRYGGTVSLNGLIVYCAYNADKLLLGRFAGAETLGIYGRAYQLISIPTENLHAAVGGVALSALSRLQNEPVRFKNYFLKGYSLFLAVTIPITVSCALFADDIVYVLLGAKWGAAAPIFRYLSPTILAFALINPVTWLLFATGHVSRSLKMACVIAPLVIIADVIGLQYGPAGVAIGFSTIMSVLTIPLIIWATHDSAVPPRELARTARPPLVAAIVAIAVSYPASIWLLQTPLVPFLRLVCEAGLLLVSYALVLIYAMGQKAFYLSLFKDLKEGRS